VEGKGPASRPPKIRELLSHTAPGFPATTERQPGKAAFGRTELWLKQWMTSPPRPGHPSGTVFAYTGLGYMVAGRVAEIVTGRSSEH